MNKSILLEAGEFTKELCSVLLDGDFGDEMDLVVLKAIGNLAVDV